MARYQLTHKAEQDIETLYEYSIRNFGLQTARSYLVGLEKLLELLADMTTQAGGTITALLCPAYNAMNTAPMPFTTNR